MARAHYHRCTVCKTPIACHAPAVDNYDGIPEKYCSALDPDQEATFVCEDCYTQGRCDSGLSADCTELATCTLKVHYLREPLRLCLACLKWELRKYQAVGSAALETDRRDERVSRVRG